MLSDISFGFWAMMFQEKMFLRFTDLYKSYTKVRRIFVYKVCENHRNMVSYLPLKKLEDSILRKPQSVYDKNATSKIILLRCE